MAVDSAQLAAYIGVDSDAGIDRDLASAKQVLDDALSAAFRPVPDDTYDWLLLEVGQAMYERRHSTSSGATQYGTLEGAVPVRAARDPLSSVRPTLARYVVPL